MFVRKLFIFIYAKVVYICEGCLCDVYKRQFLNFCNIFCFFMLSQRSRRYLKTFLEPVASFSQSMGPFRATAIPFIPKIITITYPVKVGIQDI